MAEIQGRLKSTLLAAFHGLDTSNVGMVNLSDFMRVMLEALGGRFESPQLIDLLLASGAGCVRYASFLDHLLKDTELLKPSPTSNDKLAALQAEIAELRAQLKLKTDSEASKSQKVEKPKSAQGHYDAAVEELGGESAIKASRLQSMQIAALVKKRIGIQPWEQDPIYLGLEPSVLMRDAMIASKRFTSACKVFQQTLLESGLQNEILIGPIKGIVRALTKINVKYGGDVCQLSDITRATLRIQASGKDSLVKTYAALMKMVSSPPQGVEFLHFDDRYRRPMFGGYRDFLFLISVSGILCELQVNYDTVLNVKENEGHDEYEVVRLNNDLMLDAAQKNDASTVKQHLKKGAMPNYRTARGFSALSYAATHGNGRMCSALINAKADPFQADCTGAIAVARAITMGKLEAAEVIIPAMAEQCANRSKPVVLSPPARMSVIRTWVTYTEASKNMVFEKSETLSELLHQIFVRVSGGLDAALGCAASEGCNQSCVSLIEAKAQPNAWIWGSDVDADRSSVDFAVESGHVITVRTIMRHGGVSRLYEQRPEWRKDLVDRSLQSDMAEQIDALAEASEGQSWSIDLPDLLVRASESGAADVARVALNRGATATILQPQQVAKLACSGVRHCNIRLLMQMISKGASFSMCGAAVREAASAGKVELISFLAEAGSPLEDPNELKEVPLHLAARAGHIDVVKLLHRLGCNLEILGPIGFTASHLAVEGKHTDMLVLLLELRCDINVQSERGHFLLHTAVTGNSPEAIRGLLAMGADPNPRDKNGGTPLMHAAYGGRMDALMAMATVPVGLDIAYPMDCQPFYTGQVRAGRTAAHLAAANDQVACLKVLMQLRADLTIQDAEGKTPMDVAQSEAARSLLAQSIDKISQ